jgi:hypothetical protein
LKISGQQPPTLFSQARLASTMSSPAKSPSPNCSSECTEDFSPFSEKKIDEANKEEVEKDTQEKIQEDTREDLGHAEKRYFFLLQRYPG